MRNKFLLAIAGLIACTNPETKASDDSELPALPHDVHSYAQPEKARVTNVSLDLTPDFATKRITGIARLTIQKSAGAETSVILDTRDLDIKSVKDASGAPLGFNVGAAKEFIGSPLAIALPPTRTEPVQGKATYC